MISNQNHNSKNRFQITISNRLIVNLTQHCTWMGDCLVTDEPTSTLTQPSIPLRRKIE